MAERVLLTGWGRTMSTASRVEEVATEQVGTIVREAGPRGVVARGLGRSYGDPAQNAGGIVLRLPDEADQVVVDDQRATATVGAGTSLHSLMRVLLPRGFYVPVTPGTRYVTVGGAIAADIHGKNHHSAGSFGGHVEELTLVDGGGVRHVVGPDHDPELFLATVGGMGLTGVILSARIRLRRVESGWMRMDTEKIDDVDALFERMVEHDRRAPYSVAWVDLGRGRRFGRAVLTSGDHASAEELDTRQRRNRWAPPRDPLVTAPLGLPGGLVNPASVAAFNELWFGRAPRERIGQLVSHSAFFHPLDGVRSWNRVYGRHGLLQYQLVVPDSATESLVRMMKRFSSEGVPSFLTVLKRFGPSSGGMLSFPRPGWTLAVDVAARRTLRPLLDELDREVLDAGGRLYLAKDSRASASTIAQMYPRLDAFREVRSRVDPHGRLVSDLARRLEL